MLICNCTLPYTNPEACKSCSSYLKEYTGMANDWNDWLKDWNRYTYPVTLTWSSDYDKDRYELVEKKDWKIKDTEKRLEHTKSLMRSNSDEITRLQYLETEYAKEWNLLEKELKELKKEQ